MVTYTQKARRKNAQVLLFRSLLMRMTIKLYEKIMILLKLGFFLLTTLESTAFSD